MTAFMKFGEHLGDDNQIERLGLVLDVSGSMETTDYPPNRRLAGVEACDELVEYKAKHHPNDQVAIVTFGSVARIVHPMAAVKDHERSLKHALSTIIGEGSTNITAGLQAAAQQLNQCPATPCKSALLRIANLVYGPGSGPTVPAPVFAKRIILLTDGAHNVGSSPRKAARRLKEDQVGIDVIGIGGDPSALDEPCLKDIASPYPDGSPRYCWIGDKAALLKEFKRLAGHIKPI